MKNKILILAGAALLLAFALDRTLIQPVLAQVRAALVQNVDEPGRNSFSLSATITGTNAYTNTFSVPAGKLYVVQTFTASCVMVKSGAMTDVSLLAESGGTSTLLSAASHYVGAARAGSTYRGTGSAVLYAGPGTSLQLSVGNDGPGTGAIDCQFYITGYSVDTP